MTVNKMREICEFSNKKAQYLGQFVFGVICVLFYVVLLLLPFPILSVLLFFETENTDRWLLFFGGIVYSTCIWIHIIDKGLV